MLVLKDLWKDSLESGKIENKHEYLNAIKKYTRTIEELYSLLPPEALEKYSVIETQESEIRIMEESEAFIKGFRMGARIMLDVLGDYSQVQ